TGYLRSSRYQQAFLDPSGRITTAARQLAALKTAIRDRVASHQVPVWLEQATQASQYLLAARKVMAPVGGDQVSCEKAAQEFGLDATRLGRWTLALQHKD